MTKDRGLYRENSAGQIENIYRLKVINKTQQAHRYAISLVEPGAFLLQGARELQLAPGEILDVAVSVALTAERPTSNASELRFAVADLDDPTVRVSARTTFVAPLQR